jgi:hypothetical protein
LASNRHPHRGHHKEWLGSNSRRWLREGLAKGQSLVKMQCSQGRHSSLLYSEVASLLSAPALVGHSLKVISLENPEQLRNLQALLSLVASSLVQRRISPQLEVFSHALPPLSPRLVVYSPKLKASSAHSVCLKLKLCSVPEDVYSQ